MEVLNHQLQFLWTSAEIVNHYKNPKIPLVKIIDIKSSSFCHGFVTAMWWADLGQLLCAHPVVLTPLPQQNWDKNIR